MANKDDLKTQQALLRDAPKVQKAAQEYLETIQKQLQVTREQGGILDANKQAVAETVVSWASITDSVDAINKAMENSYGRLVEAMTVSQQQATQAGIARTAYEKINELLKDNKKISDADHVRNKENLKTTEETYKAAESGSKRLMRLSRESSTGAVEAPLGAAPKAGGLGGIGGLLAAPPTGIPGAATIQRALRIIQRATQKAGGPVKKGLGIGPGQGFVGGAISAAAEQFKTLSESAAAYARLTGQVGMTDQATTQYTKRVITLQRQLKLLAVTKSEVSETTTALTTDSRTFGAAMADNTPKGRALVTELTKLALQAKRVGIDGKNFASMLDIVGKTYRSAKPVEQTRSLTTEFTNLARATGLTTAAIITDFGAAMDDLSAYSMPRAVEIFKKLEMTAFDSGVQVSKLLGTAKKFDTFESAANIVGDLNAMLGGPYLNTLDLVNASEEERIAMLKEAMAATGKTFDEMDRFEKKAIAAQLGVTVKEARGIFAGKMTEVEGPEGEKRLKPTEWIEGANKLKSVGATFTQLMAGAQKHATGFSKQLAAVQESTFMTEKAFRRIDKVSRDIVKAWAAKDVQDKMTKFMEAGFINMADFMVRHVGKAIELGTKEGQWGAALKTMFGGAFTEGVTSTMEFLKEYKRGDKDAITGAALSPGKGTPGAGKFASRIAMKGDLMLKGKIVNNIYLDGKKISQHTVDIVNAVALNAAGLGIPA